MQYYFDNAATTFPKPEPVIEAVTKCLKEGAVNAGRGVYDLAFTADQIILQTRQKVKTLLGCKSGQVVFSPSATVALNQVILGQQWKPGDRIYTTPFEHNSVARAVHSLMNEKGIEWYQLPFEVSTLSFDFDNIEEQFFKKPPTAIILSHVSNVFGMITPIEKIAKMAKKYNAKIIIDGAQAAPLLKISREDLIDFYVFSGHKTFYGPFGVAGVWLKENQEVNPILFGGTGSHSEQMEMPAELPFAFEVGSHNIVAIAGLNAACDWIAEIGAESILMHERELVSQFVAGLKRLHGIKYWFKDISEHVSTVSLNVNGLQPQKVGMILNQQFKVAVRTGLHCAPLAHELLLTQKLGGTVRVGFGWFNTSQEVEYLLDAINQITEY